MSCDWSSVSFSALTAASVTCSTGGGASVWSPTLPEECAEVPPDTPGRRPGCVADLHAVSPGFGAGHATWPRLDKEPASLCSAVTPRPPAHSPATRWVRPCARGGGTTGPWPAACAQGGGQWAAGTALAGGRGLSGQARAHGPPRRTEPRPRVRTAARLGLTANTAFASCFLRSWLLKTGSPPGEPAFPAKRTR